MKVHFIGIGGIGMSGLANICMSFGYEVSGSDSQSTYLTEELKQKGARIFLGQCASNIDKSYDMIVYTAAIHPDNTEFIAAKNSGIRMMSRAEFLGHVMDKYKTTFAISGTHGKTTTTSMLSTIFNNADLDPTILVGGNLQSIHGNYRVGKSENFITEACEYTDSFLNLHPTTAVILNVEPDHLDYFKNLDNIIKSFHTFSTGVKPNGFIVANGDEENVRKALSDIKGVIFYGRKDGNDVIITKETLVSDGCKKFFIKFNDRLIGPFILKVPGDHNVLNATAAAVSALVNGLDYKAVSDGLSSYSGVDRRFQYKGEYRGIRIFDDYAHHPSEIKATLHAASYLEKRKLIVIFQPHTFSRTKALLDDFSKAFDEADTVILTDIYASRETDTGEISSETLAEKISANGKQTVYISDFKKVEDYITRHVGKNDVVFTMGAGDVYKIGEYLIECNEKTEKQQNTV